MRRKTHTVPVGDVALGSDYPIRLQSMTNTDTMDTEATVAQSIHIAEAGGDYVRITAQGVREAEQLAVIRKELHRRGYRHPLIADIHFSPAAAETAARIVEKVRINPGNYTDRKSSTPKSYTDAAYAGELERIHERLLPLINICRQYGTAVRIGSNHGSLSERIVHHFGDSPEGMAESAMEFLRIFAAENFHQVVVSMKASNVRVMIDSTRLLAARMEAENMTYPLHLGVTEAGAGEDGRIKSAVGIGALLLEGMGDTIRVSLTEAPEAEIPVAKKIVHHVAQRLTAEQIDDIYCPLLVKTDHPASRKGKTMPVWIKEDFYPEAYHLINLASADMAKKSPEGDIPTVFLKNYPDATVEDVCIKAAIDFGPLLLSGCGAGIWIEAPGLSPKGDKNNAAEDIALAVLQACRLRMSKPEYISCPSCGRTLFDLERTAAAIRAQTAHLKGLKIGIMGCIVNGPGEMADADYGYVGAGRGRITLYRQREAVKRDIPENEAVAELIALIKTNGDWKEKN